MTTHYDAIVVGGGFGGIYSTYKLRNLGYNVHSFERESGLGGIWYTNKYPGARVDSDVPVYQLWLKEVYQDWEFTERFPGQKELIKYFEHVEKKLKVAQNYTFNTYVASCHFDENAGLWRVTTTGEGAGVYTCKYLVVCTGFAAKKYIPNFKGLDKYKGIMHHTCEWPDEDAIDFKDKRVAVVGTGASGVQVIQETGPIVKQLTVYQRTPNLTIPMRQAKIAEKERVRKPNYEEVFKATLEDPNAAGFEFGFDPRSCLEVSDEEREAHFQSLWEKGGFNFWVATFHDVWTNLEADKYQYDFWRRQTIKRITRPEMIEKLAPTVAPNPYAGKRPCLEQRYYEVYNQPNVDLISLKEDPVVEFTEKGIRSESGEREFDIIVLATGFDAITGGLLQMDIRGKNGETLAEKWGPATRTHLGVSLNNFPNMFFMYGPQGPTAFSNGPTCAQIQADFILDLIKYADKNGLKYVEPSAAAEVEWSNTCTEAQKKTVVHNMRNCWYNGSNVEGKKIEALNFIGGIPTYYKTIRAEAEAEFPSYLKVSA